MRAGIRDGRGPNCPFCGRELDRPVTVKLSTLETVQGGTCKSCGALFIVDPTGKNVGEMMSQALGELAEQLSKSFVDLVAGEDYEDAVLSYDWKTHRSSGKAQNYMDGNGRLYIVKGKPRTNSSN